MSVVELKHVTKTFGAGRVAVTAVHDVSLSIDAGEFVVLMGPSGSGKTTLLQLIGALLTPSSGDARLAGVALASLSRRQLAELRLRQVGFVFQAFNLLVSLSALGNVALPAGLAGTARNARFRRAEQLLGQLGLGHRIHHRPSELSGGEQQRVAVARALVNDPPLLLVDEPTANLDATSGYQVIHLLESIAREEGKTVLVASHDQRIADAATRLLWLADGELSDRPTDLVTVTDPICGMEIIEDRAAGHRELDGRRYSFCSQICMDRFDQGPQRFTPGSPRRDAR